MPIVGSAAVIEYLKQTEVPRTKVAMVRGSLLLDGDAVSFDLKSKAPGEPSPFPGCAKWDSSGGLSMDTRLRAAAHAA